MVCCTTSVFCVFLLFIFLQQLLEVDNGVNDQIFGPNVIYPFL